jgi:hypothetical protein
MEKKGSGNCLLSVRNNCDLPWPMRFVGREKSKRLKEFGSDDLQARLIYKNVRFLTWAFIISDALTAVK